MPAIEFGMGWGDRLLLLWVLLFPIATLVNKLHHEIQALATEFLLRLNLGFVRV
jgi:hypothetical protein